MKKIIIIIILKVFLQLPGFTQNYVVKKIVIPKKAHISILKESTGSKSGYTFSKEIFLIEPVAAPLFTFNDQTLANHRAAVKKPLSVYTELSFSDVLEYSMNSLKDGLVNTYDDHIPEVFRDAPSLIKIRFIIRL